MSAVKLSLISVVQGKPISSISRLSAERDDSLLLFLVVAPKDSSGLHTVLDAHHTQITENIYSRGLAV